MRRMLKIVLKYNSETRFGNVFYLNTGGIRHGIN